MRGVASLRHFRLHDTLQVGLQRLNITKLMPLQKQVTPNQLLDCLSEKQSTLVMAETGTGKSLACLLYALNRLLGESGRESIVQALRDRTFDEVFPEFSSPKLKEAKALPPQHGALVLVPTRELILQHYQLIRRLDTGNNIAVHRTTSIADLAAIARHIRPGENVSSLVERYGFTNMAKTLDWRLWDVAISTPKILNELVRHKSAVGQMNLDPAVVYLDECDILLMDEVYADITKALLQTLSKRPRQYVFSCSTLGPTLGETPTFTALKKWCKDLELIESPNFHKFPQNITFDYISAPETNSLEESEDSGPSEAIERLVAMIKSSPKTRFVIFAAFSSRGSIIQESLETFGIPSAMVFGEMIVEHRVQNMSKYRNGDVRVLIGGEVVSRGLALETDHVVLYDLPHNLGQMLHKVGRTGVMGKPGRVTCFVKPDDQQIVSKLRRNEKFEVSYPSRSKRKSSQEKDFASSQLEHELSELSD